ncbi:uncharacterized protein BO96DRAFT_363600 [Aspergillus niger CBS 101883]|uniref:uncharacterized protein n=1 Tax=Aspergillus lacticoffeatus (strain CBS 101883) TaxID=1450533 RepID=UPI000D7FFB72|nr:uncharacterized protein BO96DRAFT_363600 [Aspergillus niger CBS 101883]PYH58153.1 hypothetical protein BO96DRAFT_363600 [Aspergillus niger CBS 101883]
MRKAGLGIGASGDAGRRREVTCMGGQLEERLWFANVFFRGMLSLPWRHSVLRETMGTNGPFLEERRVIPARDACAKLFDIGLQQWVCIDIPISSLCPVLHVLLGSKGCVSGASLATSFAKPTDVANADDVVAENIGTATVNNPNEASDDVDGNGMSAASTDVEKELNPASAILIDWPRSQKMGKDPGIVMAVIVIGDHPAGRTFRVWSAPGLAYYSGPSPPAPNRVQHTRSRGCGVGGMADIVTGVRCEYPTE